MKGSHLFQIDYSQVAVDDHELVLPVQCFMLEYYWHLGFLFKAIVFSAIIAVPYVHTC